MIDFVCHSCGLTYHSDESHEGKAIRCSRCGPIRKIGRIETREAIKPSWASPREAYKPKARSVRLWHWARKRTRLLVVFAASVTFGAAWMMSSRSSDGKSIKKSESANNTVTVSSDELEEHSTNSLQNGTRLSKDVGTHGRGVLVLRNGNDDDAVVTLVEAASGTTVRSVYVTSHSEAKLIHMEQGSYLLLFATGIDWDDVNFEFRKGAEYHQMDRNVDFERHLPEGVNYEELTVTLHRVVGGNMPSHQISKVEFSRRNGTARK